MRLFVAVRPPMSIVDAIDALSRPELPGVRWTARAQWHVTLRFFGDVDDTAAATIGAALSHVAASELPFVARLGPDARRLGRHVVYLPATGFAPLAGAVVAATGAVGIAPEAREFRGHLTLARVHRGSRVDGATLSGLALDATWTVQEMELLRSHLGRGGARYESLAAFALGGQAAVESRS